jgi:hypothetical protein
VALTLQRWEGRKIRKTKKKGLQRLRGNNSNSILFQDFSYNLAQLAFNLQKTFVDILDFYTLGTTEIDTNLTRANEEAGSILLDDEIKKEVVDICQFFGKEQVWYLTYIDSSTEFLSVTTKQHRKITKQYYTPGVFIRNVLEQTQSTVSLNKISKKAFATAPQKPSPSKSKTPPSLSLTTPLGLGGS